jgi:hypothetical protein
MRRLSRGDKQKLFQHHSKTIQYIVIKREGWKSREARIYQK